MKSETPTLDLANRRKAIMDHWVALPGHTPPEFFVKRGSTLPADHPAVVKNPHLFVTTDYADADLPQVANMVMAQREQARAKAAALRPEETSVALVDFLFLPPGSIGNRFVKIKKGERIATNAPARRWNPKNFVPLVELQKAGRIGKHGELLPPSNPKVA